MEITIIHGQNHKGSTYHVTQMVKEGIMNSGDIIHEFFLPKDGPDFCVGCYQCIESDEVLCPQSDKVKQIAAAIIASDVVLINSPTYCFEMTGQLKTLFDHFSYQWLSHRPKKEMFGKIGVAISTTAGAGASQVTKSIARQMFWWGIGKQFRLPVKVSAARWSDVSDKTKLKIEKSVKAVTRSINKCKYPVRPGFKTRLFFGIMKRMQSSNTWNPVDKIYWQSNLWMTGEKPWN